MHNWLWPTLEAGNGNYEQALAIARQIQKKNAKSPIGYMLEGNVLMKQKKPELAVNAYEQAFAIGKSGPLMVKLHSSLSQAGKGKEADSRLTQWLKEHPADIRHPHVSGSNLFCRQAEQSCHRAISGVLRQNPKNVSCTEQSGLALPAGKRFPRPGICREGQSTQRPIIQRYWIPWVGYWWSKAT